jgi:MarR family 2-MHQ and catechol resistance regulon transcriptional repressor
MSLCEDIEGLSEMTDTASHNAVHLWLVLLKAHAAMRAHAENHIRSLGIGFSDFAVLEVLLHKGSLPVNTIGDLVRLSSGSITTAVDRLQRKKLVTRCRTDGDRRTRMVDLTAAGRSLIEAAFEDHAAAMEGASGGLNVAEREQAATLLKKLGRYAQDQLPFTPNRPYLL